MATPSPSGTKRVRNVSINTDVTVKNDVTIYLNDEQYIFGDMGAHLRRQQRRDSLLLKQRCCACCCRCSCQCTGKLLKL